MRRYPKKAVGYTDDHGKSPEQCSKCRHWLGDNACDKVLGLIDTNGWCELFEKPVRAA